MATVPAWESNPSTAGHPASAGPARPTSIELFAGAGGLALGIQKAGFRSLAAVEIDRWACDTIRENKSARHPLVQHWNVIEGDVRTQDWSEYTGKVDLVAGGPPCQPFSLGGRGRAADDPRDMFPATADVIATIRPKAFLVENVRGLTRARFADYLNYVKLRLALPEMAPRPSEPWHEHMDRMRLEDRAGADHSLRYQVHVEVVDAADYGVPQRRHRVFFVGLRSDIECPWEFPAATHSEASLLHDQWVTGNYWDRHKIPTHRRPPRPPERTLARARAMDSGLKPWATVRDALAGVPEPGTAAGRNLLNHKEQPGARSYVGHTGSPLDRPAKTLKSGGHGVPGGENMLRAPNGDVRYFTVRESAILQGFPMDYELHGSWGEAMRQIGNAVPVELARVVASSLHDTLNAEGKQ